MLMRWGNENGSFSLVNCLVERNSILRDIFYMFQSNNVLPRMNVWARFIKWVEQQSLFVF